MKRIFLIGVLLILSTVVFAQGDKDETKPKLPVDNGYPYFITTSVFPLDQGILEWTIVPIYTHNDKERNFIFFPQVTYGVTDSFLIGMGFIPLEIHGEKDICDDWHTTDGIGDTVLITQYSWIYINKTQSSASVTFNVSLPTGDINKDLTDGLIHYTPTFIWTHDLIHNNWRTQLFAQVAVSFVQRVKRHREFDPEDDITAHDFIFNGGIAERSEKINYSLEFNWITNTWNHDGNNDEKYLTPGVYVYINKNVAAGVGFPIGLTKDSDHFQIIANLLVDIETIFKKKDEIDSEKKAAKSKTKASTNRSSIPLSSPARKHQVR